MPELSKLQIRAKVLSVISEIKSCKIQNEEFLNQLIQELDEIADKNFMFDIFLKEYIKLDESCYTFCACLLKDAVPIQYISDKSIELLQSKNLSDEYKYKIVQLLRISGSDYNYSQLPEYFENPDEIMDLETKRLLNTAVYNPEAMLDFLDFVSAVSEKDKSLLLKSLALDYKGDVLANIIYPIIYSDFSDDFIIETVKILSESKSSLAIKPIEHLIETSENEEIINTCQKGLKMLKLAGASKEKADEYFRNIIKDSVPYQYFVTIPDGSGKQAVLALRKHNSGNFSIAAVVISDLSGIIDSFGFFNISQEEVIRVVKKFYSSEGNFSVPFSYVKSRLELLEKINIKNKIPFPYEYICWYPMFYDVKPLDVSLEDYANKNCKNQILSLDSAVNLMAKEYTFRWFLTPSDNDVIEKIINDIYFIDKINIEIINKLLLDNIDNAFDNNTLNIWKNRFYNLIYILRQNNKLREADEFYSIVKQENLFQLFKQVILQRSIFNYFVAEKENTKESFLKKNIFKQKNNNKYEINKLNEIIEILKRGWVGK